MIKRTIKGIIMVQPKYTNGLFNMVLIKIKQEKNVDYKWFQIVSNGFIYTKYLYNSYGIFIAILT